VVQVWLFVILLIVGLGPLVWLAKSAVTHANDIYADPVGGFAHGVAWNNLSRAWNDVGVSRYFWNTVFLATGSWLSQLVVATTGGFVLSVLRPRYAKVVTGALLATLFIPPIVLVVPLFVEIVNPPLVGRSYGLIASDWAIWLPAGATAFNVIIVKRFFDNLPRALFEAARTDGAGSIRLFFTIVLPMSKPVLGVVSIFAFLATWRDFLWPLLVFQSVPNKQPLSVRLPAIAQSTDEGVLMAAMLISAILPIVVFLIFQRTFIRGTGVGGALKG
jgi:multiple sugar transport system permease protein